MERLEEDRKEGGGVATSQCVRTSQGLGSEIGWEIVGAIC